MTVTAISINDDNLAWEFIEKALDGHYDNEIIDLNFDNWPIFHINVKGDRYNSTMPTSLMRALVEFQGHLNRVYAEVIYGKSARSLTVEERKALEIVFEIKPGSSDITANLGGFFTELGKSAVDKMTGKQIVYTVLGVAAMWASSSSHEYYIDGQQKTLIESNRHEMSMELIKNQPKLMQIQNEHIASYTAILKSVPDADNITLDQTEFSKEQVEIITRPERQDSEIKRLDDLYIITSLKKRFDRYKVEVTRVSDDRIINTELFKEHLSIDEMNQITSSFTTDDPINLNIVGRVRGDIINSANIVGINNKANGGEVTSILDRGPILIDQDDAVEDKESD